LIQHFDIVSINVWKTDNVAVDEFGAPWFPFFVNEKMFKQVELSLILSFRTKTSTEGMSICSRQAGVF
jgi:hypothetical protein